MINMMKPIFTSYAVKRLMQRHLSVDVIDQIAQVGVTVQESETRVMKRGDVNGMPVHVVIEKPNTVITLYAADEWDSSIRVRHSRKTKVYSDSTKNIPAYATDEFKSTVNVQQKRPIVIN